MPLPETGMPEDAAGDVVVVRASPVTRVAIGGAEEPQDLLALIDRGAADVDRARRRAEEGLHRALIAHRLLEGGAGQRWIGLQPGELLGEPGEAIERGADAADRRIDPGGQQ